MPTTPRGLTYPDSTGHTRLWEHLQTLASNVDTEMSRQPYCSVARAAAQSIPNGVTTAISFDTEITDTDAMFAATSTNVTIKTAGLWLITGTVGLNAAASSRRFASIRVNGNDLMINEGAATATAVRMPLSVLARLAVNDVITLAAFQNSGGAVNTLVASGDRAQLQLAWLNV